jgi:hypothetical protein
MIGTGHSGSAPPMQAQVAGWGGGWAPRPKTEVPFPEGAGVGSDAAQGWGQVSGRGYMAAWCWLHADDP